ncbi:hypothetical protein ACEXAJ_08070 [Fusobacterium necrophorum subsp. funduliforme]
MSKSLLFDLKVLEFKLKESLEQYEKEKTEENLELLKNGIDELCSFIVKKENYYGEELELTVKREIHDYNFFIRKNFQQIL